MFKASQSLCPKAKSQKKGPNLKVGTKEKSKKKGPNMKVVSNHF